MLDQLADGFLHLAPDAALVPGAQIHDGLEGEVSHVLLSRVEIGQVGQELSCDLLGGKLSQDGRQVLLVVGQQLGDGPLKLVRNPALNRGQNFSQFIERKPRIVQVLQELRDGLPDQLLELLLVRAAEPSEGVFQRLLGQQVALVKVD